MIRHVLEGISFLSRVETTHWQAAERSCKMLSMYCECVCVCVSIYIRTTATVRKVRGTSRGVVNPWGRNGEGSMMWQPKGWRAGRWNEGSTTASTWKDPSTLDYTHTHSVSENSASRRRRESSRMMESDDTFLFSSPVFYRLVAQSPPIFPFFSFSAFFTYTVYSSSFILCFRLKCLLRLLDKGEVRPEVMQKNLKLAIQVLDAVYIDEAGRWVCCAAPNSLLPYIVCAPNRPPQAENVSQQNK